MRIKALLLLLFLALPGLAESSAVPVEAFPFMAAVSAPSGPAGAELLAFSLTPAVYERADQLYGNLRVVDATWKELPFVVRRDERHTRRFADLPLETTLLSFKKLGGNRVELALENLDKKKFARKITLAAANRNFEKEARVYGGDNLDSMRELGGPQTLFDFSEAVNLSNRSLVLPENRCRYFKVVVDNFAETKAGPLKEVVNRQGAAISERVVVNTEPLRLDGVELFAQVETVPQAEPVETAKDTAFTREEANGTSVLLVSSPREPLLGFELLVGDANFLRDVRVLCSNDQTDWRLIMDGRISGKAFRGRGEALSTLRFPECRASRYRIEILNQDSPPLELKGLKSLCCIHRCVLLAEGAAGRELSLLFGGEDIRPPRYDLSAVLAGMESPVMAEAKLGEAKANPRFNPAAQSKGFDGKTLFMVVVALVVLVLLLTLRRSVGKIDSASAE